MHQNNDILNILLSHQTKQLNDNEFFLSIYFPTQHKTKIEINQQLKSEILEFFRNNIQFSDKKKLHYSLLENLSNYVNSLDEIPKSFGAFVKLKYEEDRLNYEDITFVNFPYMTDKEMFLGKTYSLDQYLNVLNINYKALIIHIERENCNIFTLKDGRFRFYLSEKNELLEYDITQRNKRPSPFSDRLKYFGGGEYTMQRRERDENWNFLNQIMDKISGDDELRKGNDFIIIFNSSEFNGSIEGFMDNNISRIEKAEVLYVKKNIRDTKEIEEKSQRLIHKYHEQKQKDLIKNLEDEYIHFAKGWDDVAKNSQSRKIEILFINPSSIKDGYIYDNNFIYMDDKELKFTKQLEKTIHAANIVPWLIKNVIESSGKVILTKSRRLGKGVNIAAKLRY